MAPCSAPGEDGGNSRALLAESGDRRRASWVGDGGPAERRALPQAILPVIDDVSSALIDGPLGSKMMTLSNGLVVGILPELGGDGVEGGLEKRSRSCAVELMNGGVDQIAADLDGERKRAAIDADGAAQCASARGETSRKRWDRILLTPPAAGGPQAAFPSMQPGI